MNYIFDILYQQSIKAQKKKEVPISALIFDPKNNRIVSKSHNQNIQDNNPCSHAEIISIIKACTKLDKNRLDGMDLYCSLEPCLMCYGAIYWSKIDTIVYGASDNKRGFTSYNLQMDRNIKTISGIMENESKNLLNKFFKKIRD